MQAQSRVMLRQVKEFLLVEGHFRSHDPHLPGGKPVCRHLEGRLNANDNLLRVLLPENVNGGGGGGIAGHHQSLHPPGKEVLRCIQGQLPHGFHRLLPVGGVGRVSEVQKPLLGHSLHQLPQNADASQPGIKHPDIVFLAVHSFTSFFLTWSHCTRKTPAMQTKIPGCHRRSKLHTSAARHSTK